MEDGWRDVVWLRQAPELVPEGPNVDALRIACQAERRGDGGRRAGRGKRQRTCGAALGLTGA